MNLEPYAPYQGQAAKDLQWEAYFNNPDDYFDNRANKINPKGPDFNRKDRCSHTAENA